MRRKDTERLIQTWFEVSSSAITKALRGMARPPLSLVQIVEDKQSAREKQVRLTPKGIDSICQYVAEVREVVIRTILDVARRFPVIRFDAAMVLAKRPIANAAWKTGKRPSSSYHQEYWRRLRELEAPELDEVVAAAARAELIPGLVAQTLR